MQSTTFWTLSLTLYSSKLLLWEINFILKEYQFQQRKYNPFKSKLGTNIYTLSETAAWWPGNTRSWRERGSPFLRTEGETESRWLDRPLYCSVCNRGQIRPWHCCSRDCKKCRCRRELQEALHLWWCHHLGIKLNLIPANFPYYLLQYVVHTLM